MRVIFTAEMLRYETRWFPYFKELMRERRVKWSRFLSPAEIRVIKLIEDSDSYRRVHAAIKGLSPHDKHDVELFLTKAKLRKGCARMHRSHYWFLNRGECCPFHYIPYKQSCCVAR